MKFIYVIPVRFHDLAEHLSLQIFSHPKLSCPNDTQTHFSARRGKLETPTDTLRNVATDSIRHLESLRATSLPRRIRRLFSSVFERCTSFIIQSSPSSARQSGGIERKRSANCVEPVTYAEYSYRFLFITCTRERSTRDK